LALAFATPLAPSAYVGAAFPVDLQVTKTDTFVAGDYTTAVLVAQVKEGDDVVAVGDFTFAGSTLVWTYSATVGWTAPVNLAGLDDGSSVDLDFTMTATGTGTFTVSFWVQTP